VLALHALGLVELEAESEDANSPPRIAGCSIGHVHAGQG
jgi:hypothetical protein